MRVLSLSVLIALAQYVAAQTPTANAFNVPNGGYSVQAGGTLDLKWNPTSGDTVTLTLRSGNPGALNDGMVIQANLPNSGSYTWTVPSNIATGDDYTVEISDDQMPSVTNYTPNINVSGGSVSGSSSMVTITTSTSVSTSTSSSVSTTSSSSDSMTTSSMPMTTSSGSMTMSPTSTRSQQSTSIQTINPMDTGAASVNRVEGAVAGLLAVGLGLGFAL